MWGDFLVQLIALLSYVILFFTIIFTTLHAMTFFKLSMLLRLCESLYGH